jgi:hypothetical protein
MEGESMKSSDTAIFNTDEYERSHGKLPHGRGNWAFGMRVCGKYETHFHNGTLADAKRAVVKMIKGQAYTFGLEYGPAQVDILP